MVSADDDTSAISVGTPVKSGRFEYKWWGGAPSEEFPESWQVPCTVAGRAVGVTYAIGSRHAHGLDRVHATIFVDKVPTIEASAVDAYASTHELAWIIKRPDGSHARSEDAIPDALRSYAHRPFQDVISGPKKVRSLAIVLREDDVAGWVRLALLRTILRKQQPEGKAETVQSGRWLFQANPAVFDLDAHLKTVSVGDAGSWSVTRYRERMRPGDLVLLWQGGSAAGIRAVAELTSTPHPRVGPSFTTSANERSVDFTYRAIVSPPIPSDEVRAETALAGLTLFRFAQATNYRLSASEWDAFVRLLAKHGVDAPTASAPVEAWAAFVEWARRLYTRPDFASTERDYKLEIAKNLEQARLALEAGSDDWISLLRRAFGPPNNLTPWQINDSYFKWLSAEQGVGVTGLRAVWDASRSAPERVAGFLADAPSELVAGVGRPVVLPSFLQMGIDALSFPIYRPEPARAAYRLCGYAQEPPRATPSAIYSHFLEFIDTFMEEAAERDLVIADRLDAQSLVWWIVRGDPPADWSSSEQDGFLAFRSGGRVASVTPGVSLHDLVERFRDERGYPTPLDSQRLQERAELASGLTPEALEDPSVFLLRRVAAGAYGSPGPQSAFMTVLGEDDGPTRVAALLAELLYGQGSYADRIEAALSGTNQVPGLKEAVLTKALSIVYPEQWLPVFVVGGAKGKRVMIERLGLEPPPVSLAVAESAVRTNEQLREVLEGEFESDTYGMKEFLYWLIERQEEPPEQTLTTLARSLYLDTEQLAQIERLLLDKRQIIFYGPPGTGKTYVAREFARYLARGGSERLRKVQFHPSYAYEDFIEGFRPDVSGQSGFKIVDGPLKELAIAAQTDSGSQYVLVIDEINRGNVAKVFGELYYLLEYRDEEISLQYSRTPFSLPSNVLIIATMNTADRSIALVDAALRRRFYFVPFFPDEPPIEGLLRKWLVEQHPSHLWVADVVDRANAMLADRNIAIGPSYFMRKELTDDWVRLIWDYSVRPYLLEHFLGDEERLQPFALDALRADTAARPTDADSADTNAN